jgi:hypothetical protein
MPTSTTARSASISPLIGSKIIYERRRNKQWQMSAIGAKPILIVHCTYASGIKRTDQRFVFIGARLAVKVSWWLF